MGIIKRFINIVNINRKDFSDDNNLSITDIENILKDDSDDELSSLITKLSDNYFPEYIINAFILMEMRETHNLESVSLQFKNLINKYHPDRNLNVSIKEKQILTDKTSKIIEAYNIIKNYLEKK